MIKSYNKEKVKNKKKTRTRENLARVRKRNWRRASVSDFRALYDGQMMHEPDHPRLFLVKRNPPGARHSMMARMASSSSTLPNLVAANSIKARRRFCSISSLPLPEEQFYHHRDPPPWELKKDLFLSYRHQNVKQKVSS